MQRFLYTFDIKIYSECMIDESEEIKDDNDCKKYRLKDIFAGLHLSIYFVMEDFQLCLLRIIEEQFLNLQTLSELWMFAFHFELQAMIEMCMQYFQREFVSIVADMDVFLTFNKRMILSALADGKMTFQTSFMVEKLEEWTKYSKENVVLCEFLPPHTLFNEENKNYILSGRRSLELGDLLGE